MCTVRLQTENKLLKAEVDSLTQQNSQQQQGLSQVQELVTMLQESHRVMTSSLASTYLKLSTSNTNFIEFRCTHAINKCTHAYIYILM